MSVNPRVDRGATAVEYGLMVAAIAAVVVAVVFGLGLLVKDTFQKTNDCITNKGKVGTAATAADC